MPIWLSQPVDAQPNVTLVRWRIFRRGNGKLHLIGYHPVGIEGRVSSAIVVFDPVTSCGVTQSGRIYKLLGWPGFDTEALYTLEVWSRARGWGTLADVTDSFVEALQSMNWRPADA